jgi:hypothetical protein
VVEFRRIAERSARPRRRSSHVVARARAFPQMELDALNWSVGRPASRAAQAARRGAKPAAQATLVQVEVSGRVNATQRNDYRGITAQVQRFAEALASAATSSTRTQLPFDITSEGTLTGDIGAAESSEAPRFTITLSRRLP